MTSIRTDSLRNIIIAVLTFAVVLAAEVGAVLFGNIALDASSLIPMGFITAVVGLIAVLLIMLAARFGRIFQAAARGDDQVTPPVTAQPDPHMALAAGESLTLQRGATVGGVVRPLVVFGLIFLVVLVMYEGFLGILLPDLPWSALWSPVNQSSLPAWFQWSIAAVLFLTFVLGIVASVIAVVRDTNYTIIADDAGITLRAKWQQTQQLPWDDILVFMRAPGYSGDQDLSAYRLFGKRHRAALMLQPSFSLLQGGGTIFGAPQRLYRFSGGIDAYRAQAQRLLATISARSHATLRAFPQGYYGRWGRAFYPLVGLTYQDVQRMPIADSAQQPTPAALLVAQRFTGKLALRRTVRGQAIARLALFVIPFLIVIFILEASFSLLTPPTHPIHSVPHYLLVNAILLLVILIIETPLLIVFYAYQLTPKVRANDAGLRIQGTGFGQRATIPWEQIQAWGMMPATGKQRNVTYAVFWSGRTISWQEPARWRRPADQAAATQLHALIAARTHLPMHAIPPRA